MQTGGQTIIDLPIILSGVYIDSKVEGVSSTLLGTNPKLGGGSGSTHTHTKNSVG